MAHKVFIFVPAFGQIITSTTFLTTHALQQHLGSKGIQGSISTLSFPDIAELRAMALSIWYDTMPDVGYLLFIDADMGFQPDIVSDMIIFDEPLVGTVYPQRKLPLSWAGSGTGTPTTERRGNFMRVEGVGMGCTLIRRDVVTKMLEVMPQIVDTRLSLHPAGETMKAAGCHRLIRAFEKLDLPDRGVVSEDLSFCLRWGQCGGSVWGAIGYRISHVGPYDYSGRYLDEVERQEAAATAAAVLQAPTDGPNKATELGAQVGLLAAAAQTTGKGVGAVVDVDVGLPPTAGGSTIAEPVTVVGAAPASVVGLEQTQTQPPGGEPQREAAE